MVTREELYAMVWSQPMVKIAEQFDVSGSYLARVCTALRVPRPERGYWAKLAVGKAPERPTLPEEQPGDQVRWSKDGDFRFAQAPRQAVPSKLRAKKPLLLVTGIHGLVRGAKAHFQAGRKVEEGQHLKPHKKLLLDVTASLTGLDKALAFANDLFNALESAGHRVVLSPQDEPFYRESIDEHEQPSKRQQQNHYGYNRLWSPYRPTVVYVGAVAIGLAVIEMSESVEMRYVNGKYIRESEYKPPKISRRYVDHTWTTTKELPCGRLRLVLYAPYRSVSWSMQFQETKSKSLTEDIADIVKAVESAEPVIVERLQEAQRQAEIWRLQRIAEEKQRRHEEDQRRIQQSKKDSHAQLLQVIQSWSDVMNLENFFVGVQNMAATLPKSEKSVVIERLKLARQFVGTQNPLDFFASWKTPTERYQPMVQVDAGEDGQETQMEDDEDDDYN